MAAVIIIDANTSTLCNASGYYKENADKKTAGIYIQLVHNRNSVNLAGDRNKISFITNTKEQTSTCGAILGARRKSEF